MDNGKKRSALDGLLGKLDSQLNSEQRFKRSLRSDPIMPSGINQLGGAGKSNLRGLRSNPNVDPLSMQPKVSKARLTNAMRKARHNQINQIRNKGGDEYGVESEFDDGSHNDLTDVDESKFKTMEWEEPDGSVTILKFDENGTLIGKEKKVKKKKSRPEKFQQDLKVEREHKNWKAKALQAQANRQQQVSAITQGVVGGQ